MDPAWELFLDPRTQDLVALFSYCWLSLLMEVLFRKLNSWFLNWARIPMSWMSFLNGHWSANLMSFTNCGIYLLLPDPSSLHMKTDKELSLGKFFSPSDYLTYFGKLNLISMKGSPKSPGQHVGSSWLVGSFKFFVFCCKGETLLTQSSSTKDILFIEGYKHRRSGCKFSFHKKVYLEVLAKLANQLAGMLISSLYVCLKEIEENVRAMCWMTQTWLAICQVGVAQLTASIISF